MNPLPCQGLLDFLQFLQGLADGVGLSSGEQVSSYVFEPVEVEFGAVAVKVLADNSFMDVDSFYEHFFFFFLEVG